jgi:hypothetical protein
MRLLLSAAVQVWIAIDVFQIKFELIDLPAFALFD